SSHDSIRRFRARRSALLIATAECSWRGTAPSTPPIGTPRPRLRRGEPAPLALSERLARLGAAPGGPRWTSRAPHRPYDAQVLHALGTMTPTLWLDAIRTAVILGVAWVTVYNIKAWRRELVGKRKYELAEEVLALF